jgi:hypothetical protein
MIGYFHLAIRINENKSCFRPALPAETLPIARMEAFRHHLRKSGFVYLLENIRCLTREGGHKSR